MRLFIAGLTVVIFCTSGATGAPVTMACQLYSPRAPSPHPFGQANQLILDIGAQTVELRAAETMGTSNPVNWIFANRTGPLGNDTMTIRSDSSGAYGTGFYGAGVHSFSLNNDGTLWWTIDTPDAHFTHAWHCQK